MLGCQNSGCAFLVDLLFRSRLRLTSAAAFERRGRLRNDLLGDLLPRSRLRLLDVLLPRGRRGVP